MKTIETLIEDIQNVLTGGVEASPENIEKIQNFGKALADNLVVRLTEKYTPRLRMSNIGKPCGRQLWYEINQSEDQEPLTPETKLKFEMGHLIEDYILLLADLAGHSVEGRQDTQELHGVQGHRDAVIDGVIVDVKTASSYGFYKFKDHKLNQDDAFGYITQLQSYLEAGQTDPVVTDKSRAAFLAIEKSSGELCLDIHQKENFDFAEGYERRKQMVTSKIPPEKAFFPVEDGKSGNMKLGVNCSYCSFKKTCFPQLRKFLYSSGPRYLTRVERLPDVPEEVV